jgi:hypothetical protein
MWAIARKLGLDKSAFSWYNVTGTVTGTGTGHKKDWMGIHGESYNP